MKIYLKISIKRFFFQVESQKKGGRRLMPWLLFLQILLLAVTACQSAHATRQCTRCTFLEEDDTLSKCSMCDDKLKQPGAGGSCSVDSTALPGEPLPGECGWPCNDGKTCSYATRHEFHLARHRRECKDHSIHRARLDAQDKQPAGLLPRLFKRQRSENAASSAKEAPARVTTST